MSSHQLDCHVPRTLPPRVTSKAVHRALSPRPILKTVDLKAAETSIDFVLSGPALRDKILPLRISKFFSHEWDIYLLSFSLLGALPAALLSQPQLRHMQFLHITCWTLCIVDMCGMVHLVLMTNISVMQRLVRSFDWWATLVCGFLCCFYADISNRIFQGAGKYSGYDVFNTTHVFSYVLFVICADAVDVRRCIVKFLAVVVLCSIFLMFLLPSLFEDDEREFCIKVPSKEGENKSICESSSQKGFAVSTFTFLFKLNVSLFSSGNSPFLSTPVRIVQRGTGDEVTEKCFGNSSKKVDSDMLDEQQVIPEERQNIPADQRMDEDELNLALASLGAFVAEEILLSRTTEMCV